MDLVISNQSCNHIPHISCLTLLTTKETWDLVFVNILVLIEITVHLYSLCLNLNYRSLRCIIACAHNQSRYLSNQNSHTHTQKNEKVIKILELQCFNYVTVWVNSLWSGHKFFVKGSRILYTFGLLKMAWESQTAVLEHFEADEYYYLYSLYFERLDFVLCQFGLCWISGFS